MLIAIDRSWRIFGTGLAIGMFYLGCLFGGPVLIGFAIVAFRSADRRSRFLQRAFQRSFAVYELVVVHLLGLLTVEAKGFDTVREPSGRLILANHPTLLDVVLLIARQRSVDCVVKEALFQSIFTRACVGAAGYVPNADGRTVIDASIARLLAGRDVLLFPEGTRSPQHGLRGFQRGAARIALASGCDVVPVFIECNPVMLTKESKWYQVPHLRPHYRLRVGEPIQIHRHVSAGLSRPAAVRALTAAFEGLFDREIVHEPP